MPLIFLKDFYSQDLILRWLRIENAALMRPWGINSAVPSERLFSSSMDSWPHYRILEAQFVAGFYDLNPSNGLLTCYGSPSDNSLALHHLPHNGPRSTSLWLSDSDPGSTGSYDMFLNYTGYLIGSLILPGIFY